MGKGWHKGKGWTTAWNQENTLLEKIKELVAAPKGGGGKGDKGGKGQGHPTDKGKGKGNHKGKGDKGNGDKGKGKSAEKGASQDQWAGCWPCKDVECAKANGAPYINAAWRPACHNCWHPWGYTVQDSLRSRAQEEPPAGQPDKEVDEQPEEPAAPTLTRRQRRAAAKKLREQAPAAGEDSGEDSDEGPAETDEEYKRRKVVDGSADVALRFTAPTKWTSPCPVETVAKSVSGEASQKAEVKQEEIDRLAAALESLKQVYPPTHSYVKGMATDLAAAETALAKLQGKSPGGAAATSELLSEEMHKSKRYRLERVAVGKSAAQKTRDSFELDIAAIDAESQRLADRKREVQEAYQQASAQWTQLNEQKDEYHAAVITEYRKRILATAISQPLPGGGPGGDPDDQESLEVQEALKDLDLVISGNLADLPVLKKEPPKEMLVELSAVWATLTNVQMGAELPALTYTQFGFNSFNTVTQLLGIDTMRHFYGDRILDADKAYVPTQMVHLLRHTITSAHHFLGEMKVTEAAKVLEVIEVAYGAQRKRKQRVSAPYVAA